jgi:hypothetical protein
MSENNKASSEALYFYHHKSEACSYKSGAVQFAQNLATQLLEDKYTCQQMWGKIAFYMLEDHHNSIYQCHFLEIYNQNDNQNSIKYRGVTYKFISEDDMRDLENYVFPDYSDKYR